MATISSQPSAETSRKLRFGRLMPALFTRISMRPCFSRMLFATFDTALRSLTSSAIDSRPGWRSVFALRPEITTVAPAPFSACAAARPIPEPPPVIQATLPFNVLGCAKQVLLLFFCHLPRTARILQDVQRALHRRPLEERIAPLPERR